MSSRAVVREEAADPVVVRIVTGSLWGAVLTQMLALPGNIQFSMLFLGGACVLLLAANRMALRPWRLVAFLLLVTLLAGTSIVGFGGAVSIPAFGMAIALYGIFVFVVPASDATYREVARGFVTLALFIAAMVGVQMLQVIGLPYLHLNGIIPEGLVFKAYNYLQPMRYGSSWLKPNGIFMLEASHCSQLMAMAIVAETCLFQRPIVIAALTAALLATLSGTGVLILLISVPFLLPYLTRKLLIFALTLLVIALIVAFATGLISFFLHRTTEFGQGGTSGNGRFIEPYQFMIRSAVASIQHFLFGVGMGNAQGLEGRSQTIVLSPLAKTIVEVGVPAAVAWLLYFHVAMLRSMAPLPITIALLLQYDLMNGSLIVPIHLAYCFLIAGAFVRAAPAVRAAPRLPLPHRPQPLGGLT